MVYRILKSLLLFSLVLVEAYIPDIQAAADLPPEITVLSESTDHWHTHFKISGEVSGTLEHEPLAIESLFKFKRRKPQVSCRSKTVADSDLHQNLFHRSHARIWGDKFNCPAYRSWDGEALFFSSRSARNGSGPRRKVFNY